MKCAEIHERVVLAAYGELPDDQMHLLATHLAGCAGCREEQEQLLALKTLSAAYPVIEPDANLVARSRTRLAEALDALPPKRWYDRLAEWMTRTAAGLQAAPVAACLLLVAGAGLGSLGGYEFAERHAVIAAGQTQATSTNGTPIGDVLAEPAGSNSPAATAAAVANVAGISGIVRRPNSNLVEVTYNEVKPRRVEGTLENPQIRQLLMLASQNATSPGVRDDSVGILAAACRTGHGCQGSGVQGGAQGTDIRDALMISLRYDPSSAVREKALEGLQPFVSEDMQVRNAVLGALLNDPEAKVRSQAIGMLEPVEADTSVRQVLSTVALSDQNSHIRTASRAVLSRVSEIQ
jgi:hypothetical protein